MNRTSRWAGKFPDILISDHVLSLPPPIRKFQTVDPRIGYRAAADIGRLEWHARFMVPFEAEVGVGDDRPFSACRRRIRREWRARNGPPGSHGSGGWHLCYARRVLRPGSWSRPAGGSPVRVSAGAPGSRPRFVVERRRAERGVKSLFGGSEHAGRSVKRTLQPRQSYNGRAEPLMSRRRPRLAGLGPVVACQVSPGYGGRHVWMVWAGTGETRLPGLRRAKTRRISRW
jgi:hypothetical protein